MNEPGESRSRLFDRRDAIVVAVLVAVILLYFRSLLWTDSFIYGELDIRRHFYLFKKVSYELMRGGELPLWIPYLYCGMPLLAALQVTPFYPPDLAFMLARVPLNMAFNWDLLAHLVAAQVFSFLFFRRLLRRRVAAVFCSMWFWNAFFLGSVIIGDALNIRAMLLVPAVFYFTEAGLGEGGRPRHFLFGALALSMQMLCGGLQFTFYTMVAITAYAAFLLVARARRGDEVARPLVWFGVLIIVALAMASVQLLPQWEYSRLSVRATGIPWFKVWALKPYQLVDYIVPMFEGEGTAHGYFGIVAIVLAAYSLPFWKDSRKYFFLALGAVSIIYSLGGNTVISSYLAGLPLVRGFRGPFRAAILFNLSVFVLAGGALVSVSDSDGGRPRGRRLISFGIVSILLVGGFIAAALFSRSYSDAARKGIVSSAVFLALSIPAAFVLFFSSRLRTVGSLALIALLAGDIVVNYGNSYSPTSLSTVTEKDWVVDRLKEDNSTSRIAVYNTPHANYFGLFGIESANGHHPFPTARCARFLPLLKKPAIASLAGVKHNVIYALDERGVPYNPPVKRPDQAFIQTLPLAPLPRAFLVGKYRVLPPEQVLSVMQEREFDPSREVLLEEAPVGLGPPVELPTEGVVTIRSRTGNEIILDTACEHEAVLVLCESYYPGWRAEVDGKAAQLLTADYVFRAVPLAEGRHEVVFRLRPMSFIVGTVISCMGIAAWLVWAFLLCIRRSC